MARGIRTSTFPLQGWYGVQPTRKESFLNEFSAEVLLVGGGGAGGRAFTNDSGGGGGAGGSYYYTDIWNTATVGNSDPELFYFNVIVGTGGAGTTSTSRGASGTALLAMLKIPTMPRQMVVVVEAQALALQHLSVTVVTEDVAAAVDHTLSPEPVVPHKHLQTRLIS
jgi:hypothetical protein